MAREGSCRRSTQETKIGLKLDLDGNGQFAGGTGLAFFDHMLNQLAKHSYMELNIVCEGDLEVDSHHTVEDVGLALGDALSVALADKKGLTRFGSAMVPLDESLARVSVDLSGRPYLYFDAQFNTERLGSFETETVEEFLRAFAMRANICLHVEILHGSNTHHKIEAIFKALAVALRQAWSIAEGREDMMPSTKGAL